MSDVKEPKPFEVGDKAHLGSNRRDVYEIKACALFNGPKLPTAAYWYVQAYSKTAGHFSGRASAMTKVEVPNEDSTR